jgi:hypothetical protein
MADNTTLNPGTGGDVISTDDIGGSVKVQRVKVQVGVDGAAADVNVGNALPIRMVASTSSVSRIAVNTGSTTIAASDPDRLRLVVVNDSSTSCYVKYGTAATPNSLTYRLSPGSTLEETGYTGIVTATLDTGTGHCHVTILTA